MDIQNTQDPSNVPSTPRPALSAGAQADRISLNYTGTGGELFGQAIIGMILTSITFGLYAPWLLVRLQKYFYSRTMLNTPSGPVTLSFSGTGGLALVDVYLTALLVPLTFGIYTPWYIASVLRFFLNNSIGTAADGKQYRLGFTGTGGDLLVPVLVNGLLTSITFGIYAPWAICNLRQVTTSKMGIFSATGEQLGRFEFVGTGGGLIGTFLLGMILTMVTFGIYSAWFQVNLLKFYNRNTGIHIGGRAYRGDFRGTGGELFMIFLSALLIPLTFGIYLFWYITNQERYQLNNTSFTAA